MQSYHHFTQSERGSLVEMGEAAKSYRAIGQAIGKSGSSICRALQRNQWKHNDYKPHEAFLIYCVRRRKCVRQSLLQTKPEMLC